MTAVMPEPAVIAEPATEYEFSAHDALAVDLYKLFLRHGVPCGDVPEVRYLTDSEGIWGVTIQAYDRSSARPAGGEL